MDCLFVCYSVYLFVGLLVCLLVCLFTFYSVCLFFGLLVHLLICFFVVVSVSSLVKSHVACITFSSKLNFHSL